LEVASCYSQIYPMAYSFLSLKQFRSYKEAAFEFSPSVNIVAGPNGSGKTNLLEAVYVLSQGASFRVSDKDLITEHCEWFRLDGRYGEQHRVLTYDQTKTPNKQFLLDNVKKQRLTYVQKVPLVLFEPNELRLLNGSPQRRRDYVDALLARLWPEAAAARHRFERALLQRNNLIRQAEFRPLEALEDALFVWDIKLAEYAATLVGRRLELLGRWNERLSDAYSRIAATPTTVQVIYSSEVALENYKADLLRQLVGRRHRDIARGFTSVGPHREDITVVLNGADAAVTASRGELRTLVLAIKIIELELLDSLSDKHPLLLLDDVFSELDTTRRRSLAEQARQFQTIITTTDADTAARYFAKNHNLINLPGN
jgi:DNA replication and repair protein RecF